MRLTTGTGRTHRTMWDEEFCAGLVHARLHMSMSGSLKELSKREHEIAERYAEGQTYKEIAEALSRSPSTIRNHLATIYQKLKIGNKAELVQLLLALRASAMPLEGEVSDHARGGGPEVNDTDEREASGTVEVNTAPRQTVVQASQEDRQVTLIVLELDIHERNGDPVDIELLEARFAEFAENVRGEIERSMTRGSSWTSPSRVSSARPWLRRRTAF